MSFPIPTTNINKKSDLFDDSMVCGDDNWTVNNVDGNHKENTTSEIKNKSMQEKIPPKSDTRTCASPKSKKRKLSTYNEILDYITHNLDYEVLYTNLTKLLFFLESDNEECLFPFTSKEYEAFFEILLQDVNILKTKCLNADYGCISDKIIKAAACNSLFYVFENRPEYETKIMVIKKLPKMDQSENSPSASRTTATEVPPTNRPRDSDSTVQSSSSMPDISIGFKIHCLRSLIAFIKNKTMNTKEFPELNADQAKFMLLLLGKVSVSDFGGSTEEKELYTALVQAVQMYRMQFGLKIQCVENWGGKKTVIFEKVPKPLFSETIDDSNEMAVDSAQTMNPNADVSNADPSNSQTPNKPAAPNIDTKKSLVPKGEIPKQGVPELQGRKTDAAFPQGPKMAIPNSQNSKINVSKTTAPESQAPKSYAQASKIEIPKSNFPDTKPDEKSTSDKLRYEMDMLLIKNTPRQFISVTLNKILNFLLDWNSIQKKLVFVPNNQAELEFYKKCIDWCRSGTELCMFGEEFRDLQCRVSRLMTRFNIEATKKTANALNKVTGLREVSYVKSIKIITKPPSAEAVKQAEHLESQSSPRKSKVNVKKTLELAATENIKVESVINLYQSLRSKKKNKKLKKAELERANNRCESKEESVKPEPKMSNGSNSSDKERTQSAAKRPSSEMSQSPRSARRPTGVGFRKEQLIEALSVPVQSEIAMRMMVGMGWSGGALGVRGDGITEPIMPALDIANRAGLGLASHKAQKQASNQSNETSKPVKVARKMKKPKSNPSLIFNSETEVGKTEQQPGNSTSEATTKTNDEIPKTSSSKFQFTSAWTSNAEVLKSQDELSKPTASKLKPLKPNAKPPPTQTRYNMGLEEPENVAQTTRLPFRQEILKSVWDLLSSDLSCITLKYDIPLNKKEKRFINLGLSGLKAKNACYTYGPNEVPLCTQIRQKYAEHPEIFVDARYYFDFKAIDLLKLPTAGYTPSQQPEKIKPNFDMKLTEENLHSYILNTNGACESPKQFENLKFRVLFLFNVLNFVKSLDEEVEITCNRVLNKRQLIYMENVIDEVNMRIKFGSTRAEVLLGDQIRENVKDAFLGLMCNHQFMIVTISKYYRFKRLNRPDNAVKRKAQTAVNLDDFTCETVAKSNTGEVKREPIYEPHNTKIKYEFNHDDAEVTYEIPQDKYIIHEETAEASTNSSDEASKALPISKEPYDSDESSIEEYINNNANTKVPKVKVEGYDNEKTNATGTKNSNTNNNYSASKVTDNRNNKNNFGNGNVVIDNNDNQFVDMKRQGGHTNNIDEKKDILDWATADYDDICFDYNEEEEFMNPVNSIKNNEEVITEKKALKPQNVKEIHSNPKNFYNNDVIVVEDSDSDNDCHKDIIKHEINDIINNPSLEDSKDSSDVIMKDIDVEKSIELIDITEDSMEGIDGDESKPASKEKELTNVKDENESVTKFKYGESTFGNRYENKPTIKGELISVIKSSEITEEINKDESTAVIQVESSKNIKVAQVNIETSISPSNIQIAEDNLEIKTDCDNINKKNIDLSEKDICDNHSVDSSHENTETDLLNDKNSEIRHVRIEHTHHPIIKLTLEKVKKIQRHISNSIGRDAEIPLLKCHGSQNGVLFYSCHNKKSYDWLQRTISDASFAKFCDNKVIPTKMVLKMFCSFDFDSLYLFNMLEVCNKGISTKEWVVEKTEKNGDYIFFNVKMDDFSIKFIQKSNFELCAGVNKAEFILVWE